MLKPSSLACPSRLARSLYMCSATYPPQDSHSEQRRPVHGMPVCREAHGMPLRLLNDQPAVSISVPVGKVVYPNLLRCKDSYEKCISLNKWFLDGCSNTPTPHMLGRIRRECNLRKDGNGCPPKVIGGASVEAGAVLEEAGIDAAATGAPVAFATTALPFRRARSLILQGLGSAS